MLQDTQINTITNSAAHLIPVLAGEDVAPPQRPFGGDGPHSASIFELASAGKPGTHLRSIYDNNIWIWLHGSHFCAARVAFRRRIVDPIFWPENDHSFVDSVSLRLTVDR